MAGDRHGRHCKESCWKAAKKPGRGTPALGNACGGGATGLSLCGSPIGASLGILKDQPQTLRIRELSNILDCMSERGLKIGSIVIHSPEFDSVVKFWSEALGYVPRNPASGGWVVLRDPEGRGPNLSFQGRETRPSRRSWIHLDLYAENQEQEVERLVELGANRYPWRYRPHADYVVMEDPGGNLFCVVQMPKSSG
jgi:hypothetical protein